MVRQHNCCQQTQLNAVDAVAAGHARGPSLLIALLRLGTCVAARRF
jgi:hypothetical protein